MGYSNSPLQLTQFLFLFQSAFIPYLTFACPYRNLILIQILVLSR